MGSRKHLHFGISISVYGARQHQATGKTRSVAPGCEYTCCKHADHDSKQKLGAIERGRCASVASKRPWLDYGWPKCGRPPYTDAEFTHRSVRSHATVSDLTREGGVLSFHLHPRRLRLLEIMRNNISALNITPYVFRGRNEY
jgi:hypothetical protein